MVHRTHNSFSDTEEEDEDTRRYSDLDKQKNCDICKGEITNVRIIRSTIGIGAEKYLGVYCSVKCSSIARLHKSNAV